MILLTVFIIELCGVLFDDGASGLNIHDLNWTEEEGVFCSDGSAPLTEFRGNENAGWLTVVGCGYSPHLVQEPGGCKIGAIYAKPIVTIDQISNGRYRIEIKCDGKPEDVAPTS